jgi:hypothetical protein
MAKPGFLGGHWFRKFHLRTGVVGAILISSFDEITIYARIHGRHQGAVRPQPRADSPGAPYYRLPGRKAPAVVRKAMVWVQKSVADTPEAGQDRKKLKQILKLDPKTICQRQLRR